MKMGINKITFLLLLVIPLSACRTNKEYSVDIQTEKTEEKISQIIVSLDKDNDPTIDHYQKIEEFDDDIHKSEEDTKSRDKEKETPDDSKYLEMDIKQFLIDNYNFKEEEIDPDYDLLAFMKAYRLDEGECTDDLVRTLYECSKDLFLPGSEGYVKNFLSINETVPITREDKIVKIGFSWEEYDNDFPLSYKNALYDLVNMQRYSDIDGTTEIDEDRLESLYKIVENCNMDEWELNQSIGINYEISDEGPITSWKIVFELVDGSKRVYKGAYGPLAWENGSKVPDIWWAIRDCSERRP